MNKHIKVYEQFVNETSNEGTLNESVYGEYVKKVGPALTKFLKEKGLNWPTPFKATEQKGYIQIDSAPVSGKDLGIMQYGFKSVVLTTRYGTEAGIMSDGVPDLIVFGLSYQYEHPNGGTNGTDLILPGTRYNNIFYSKTHDKFYTWETQPNPEMKMNESRSFSANWYKMIFSFWDEIVDDERKGISMDKRVTYRGKDSTAFNFNAENHKAFMDFKKKAAEYLEKQGLRFDDTGEQLFVYAPVYA
jgi:hypothetical protein